MSRHDQADTEAVEQNATDGWTNWILLGANRWHLAGLTLTGLFVALVLLGLADPAGLRATLSSGDPLDTLFQALIAGIITGVTLVVTINQVVLSQELGAVGDQRERMRGALDFRDHVAGDVGESAMPAEPADFVAAVLEAIGDGADAVQEAVPDQPEARRAELESVASELETAATAVANEVENAEFGTMGVLGPALAFDYSRPLHDLREFHGRWGADLSEQASERLVHLETMLAHYGTTREHIKTLYFQWELIALSRAMVYTSIPALLTAVGMVLFVGPEWVPGSTLGVDHLLVLASAATTVALAPFVLLLVHMLRIATIARRTLAIGPFVLLEGDESDESKQD